MPNLDSESKRAALSATGLDLLLTELVENIMGAPDKVDDLEGELDAVLAVASLVNHVSGIIVPERSSAQADPNSTETTPTA